MEQAYADKVRNPIPRWREYHVTKQLGELQSTAKPRAGADRLRGSFERRRQEWANHKTISYALDLISCAIVESRENEVLDAAEFVAKSGDSRFKTAREVAGLILKKNKIFVKTQPVIHIPRQYAQARVSELKHALKLYPNNPFAWSDLARAHETLGNVDKAVTAMDIALDLAPDDRFIVRCACRMYVHRERPDLAQRLLKRTAGLLHDPWLLAAEVAVSGAARRSSQNIKWARKLLDAKSYAPFHLTELAVALGTEEANAGNYKRARRYISEALADPTENTIAQAAWLSRQHRLDFDDEQTSMDSPEALAFQSFLRGKWDHTIERSIEWLSDQPFSSRPAQLGSYTASLVNELNHSIEIAEQGLYGNPKDFLLLNNLAYGNAKIGNLKSADKYMTRLMTLPKNETEDAICLATRGLLAYRHGNAEQGRQLYLSSLEKLQHIADVRTRALGMINFALEELNVNPVAARAFAVTVLTSMKEIQMPDIKLLLKQLESACVNR